MEFSFIDQMSETVKFNLAYPYHINFDKLIGNRSFDKESTNCFHAHKLEDVLYDAYLEPYAFQLTEDDLFYYSSQELEFVGKILEDSKEHLDNGDSILSLDLDEQTIKMLCEYKTIRNITFNEAAMEILRKAFGLPQNEDLKRTEEKSTTNMCK